MLTFIVVQLIGDSPFLQTANAEFYVTLNGAPSVSEEEPGAIDRELRKLLESYGSLMTFEKQEVRHFFFFLSPVYGIVHFTNDFCCRVHFTALSTTICETRTLRCHPSTAISYLACDCRSSPRMERAALCSPVPMLPLLSCQVTALPSPFVMKALWTGK